MVAAPKAACRVRHAHLYGLREGQGGKYAFLKDHDVTDGRWETLEPDAPFYFLTPQNNELREEYDPWWQVTDIFPLHGTGVITKRDFLSIDMDEKVLWERVKLFGTLDEADCRERLSLPKDVRDWQYPWAKKDVITSGPSKCCIKPILYRPFDQRHIYYTGQTRGFIGWPVTKVMRHMLAGGNVGLIATRLTKESWAAFCTSHIMGHKSCSAYDINTLFPLYLYPSESGDMAEMGLGGDGAERRPNLVPDFVRDFAGLLGLDFVSDGRGDLKHTFGPEDVFHYIYAVFHSPAYRERYAEFLKMDFPRLPLTGDLDLFRELCKRGERLVALHLMEAKVERDTDFPVEGDNVVGTVKYDAEAQAVTINKTQRFAPVPEAVWAFQIGGYQVCHKWLKDRKGRALSAEDIEHYRYIVAALGETIALMGQIDETIDAHGGWPGAFQSGKA